jgi:hypothetical protein
VELIAVTVKIDELPELIEMGFAETVTAGAGFVVTVTIAIAEAFPPAPVAEAV